MAQPTSYCPTCDEYIYTATLVKCPNCNTQEDRDIHAANNMIYFYLKYIQ